MALYKMLFRIYYFILNIDFKIILLNKIKYRFLSYFGILIRNYAKKHLSKSSNKIINTNSSNHKKLIVSLTTFPARIDIVPLVIESIFLQSVQPDKVILWLAESQFSSEKKLPSKLLEQKKRGLEIKFCEDLKPHKKYYYTLKKYPDDIIITLDDDVFYPPFLLKTLYDLYKEYPNCISCTRGHYITFDNNNQIKPYKEWIALRENRPIEPSELILPTGVGGVLYPPNSLNEEIFNKENIKKLCLNADDLWLKIMALKNNTKVVISRDNFYKFITVNKTQINALSHSNLGNEENDKQLAEILDNYDIDIKKENIRWSNSY